MKYWLQLHQIGRFRNGDALIDIAKLAEDLGFDALALPDHIIFPTSHEPDLERPWPEQLTIAAYLAAHTSTLKFRTAATILTQRDPILFAKQLATVDFLSDGRLGIGVAPGWLEPEIRWLGFDPRTRGKRLEEYIRLIRTLLTEDPVNFEGPFHSISDASFHPKPRQPFSIFVGGTAVRSARRAARLGDGWQPSGSFEEYLIGAEVLREELAGAGRDFSSFPKVIEIPTYDFPDNVIRHYRETGTPPPETFGGDIDKTLNWVAVAEAAGVTHSVLFPAIFSPEELGGQLRLFSRHVIQA